jgi:uncharacterized membrane-anchored protein
MYKPIRIMFVLSTVLIFVLLQTGVCIAQGSPAVEESKTPDSSEKIQWQKGPCTGELGDYASLPISDGYGFTGKDGAIRFMQLNQNPTSGNELGIIICRDAEWFVVFEYDDSGHVKDDEKDSLDADAILASIKAGNDKANEYRASKGWDALQITGWQHRPYYDSVTHNLTWAIGASDKSGAVINHSVRLLGREGVMHVDLVGNPEQLPSAVTHLDTLLKSFTFKQGHRYAEFRRGDKLAAYGLTALIAGGAGAALAKSGLLAKFWKLILVGIVAVGGAIMRCFKSLFSRGVEKAPELPKQE